jgi:hypothetical protein
LKPFWPNLRSFTNVSNRLEALAEQHPPVSEALMMISGSVRDTATVLEVLIVTKTAKPN